MASVFKLTDLYSLISWGDKFFNCKMIEELIKNHESDGFVDPLVIPSEEKQWTECASNIELLENLIKYLHLNLTLIQVEDLDLGWFNGTHSRGSIDLFINNQADLIVNNVNMDSFHHDSLHLNLYDISNPINEFYQINFFTRKKSIQLTVKNFFNIFHWTVWLLFLTSILIIPIPLGFVLLKRSKLIKEKLFTFNVRLSIDYLNMLLSSQGSDLLPNLNPRHHLMYLIPLLSIIVVNLLNSSIYSNMISPPKQWCQTLDCFANSSTQFYSGRNYYFGFDKDKWKNQWQVIKIMKRHKLERKPCEYSY